MKRFVRTDPKVDGMRLCSMPGGQWQLQHRTAVQGTNKSDCWDGVRRPTDFVTAWAQLRSYIPLQIAQ